MTGRHIIMVSFLTLALLGGAAFGVWRLFLAPPSVGTAPVRVGRAVDAVYATAVVEPVTWAAIAPIRTGRIVEVSVSEGDTVQAGDVLARLDDADLRAQMEEAQALEKFYTAELERAEKLIGKGAIAQEKYEARIADLAQARARVAMFGEQIRQLSLSAPVDGTVLWRDVEPGEVKEAGAPLFWVGEPKPLRLEAEIDEEDIPKIKTGQRVLITADAFPDRVMEGVIDRITPKGDPVNKSYRVYVGLPAGTNLMIGMTVETNTVAREKDGALLVPAEALTDGPAVWLAAVENGETIARKTPVETGIVSEEQAEITKGVHEGDRIILPPFDALEDGAAVRTGHAHQ